MQSLNIVNSVTMEMPKLKDDGSYDGVEYDLPRTEPSERLGWMANRRAEPDSSSHACEAQRFATCQSRRHMRPEQAEIRRAQPPPGGHQALVPIGIEEGGQAHGIKMCPFLC